MDESISRRDIRCHVNQSEVDEIDVMHPNSGRSIVEINGEPHVYSDRDHREANCMMDEIQWDIIQWIESHPDYGIVWEIEAMSIDPWSDMLTTDFTRTFADYQDARGFYDSCEAEESYDSVSMVADIVH